MTNWHTDKNKIIQKMCNAIYAELECLLNDYTTANYWIDNTHNVFAMVNDNGNGDRWIEVHFELYDINENIIGDITVLDTDDINENELRKVIKDIVGEYFHE